MSISSFKDAATYIVSTLGENLTPEDFEKLESIYLVLAATIRFNSSKL